MKKIGLVINPIAGMGGKVGLKGTDGPKIAEKARMMGAEPESQLKAAIALEQLAPLKGTFELLTCPGSMGEKTALQCGFAPRLIGSFNDPSTAADTEKAVLRMRKEGLSLLLFAGGDGTARNIYNALGEGSDLPVIGIPAGVKIHSAVYATSPRSAGELACRFMELEGHPVREAEVMDIDEEAFRRGSLSARLYGYLSVPCADRLMQHLKVGRIESEESVLEGIAARIVEGMKKGTAYIIGPGSTTAPIMKLMGLPNTLLGVDVVLDGKLVQADAAESRLLEITEKYPARIVVTVIGGQGYIFGRGNQQISARVIKRVGRENIIVVAVKEKLLSLQHGCLLADTGDDAVNNMLKGYHRIVTGFGEEVIFPLET